MQVKIDTSERFHVITILEPHLSANMTELLENKLSVILNGDVRNVVLNLQALVSIDSAAMKFIIDQQQAFNKQQASFVTCCMPAVIKQQFQEAGRWDELNNAPTQSEASDIVQMEEIERELGE